MKVTTSEIEGNQVVLEMEIEPERVEKAMDRAYRKLVSRVNIPGFRRGKAPRVLLERVVGRQTLMDEALEILVPEAYKEAVKEAGIVPVDNPKLDVVSAEPLSVRATIPVRPKVQLGDYRSIRQSVETPEVTPEQVEIALENLRQAKVLWLPVDREAGVGDRLTFDMRARAEVGDRTFVDQQGAERVLDPDRTLLAPGVMEQLIGMKAGDRKAFDVTLPEDFQDKELAGHEAAIEVSAIEVMEKRVPELDDELARSVGDYSSLEELRRAMAGELQGEALAQAKRGLEESVLAAVVDQAVAEPPAQWVEEQGQALVKSRQERVKREGLTWEQYLRTVGQTEEGLLEEMSGVARRQLKRSMVLDTVAERERISVSEAELEALLGRVIAESGGKVDAAERERLKTSLGAQIRERKALDRLVQIATGAAEDEEAAAAEEDGPAEESDTGEQG